MILQQQKLLLAHAACTRESGQADRASLCVYLHRQEIRSNNSPLLATVTCPTSLGMLPSMGEDNYSGASTVPTKISLFLLLCLVCVLIKGTTARETEPNLHTTSCPLALDLWAAYWGGRGKKMAARSKRCSSSA